MNHRFADLRIPKGQSSSQKSSLGLFDDRPYFSNLVGCYAGKDVDELILRINIKGGLCLYQSTACLLSRLPNLFMWFSSFGLKACYLSERYAGSGGPTPLDFGLSLRGG